MERAGLVPGPGFLSLSTADVLDWIIICRGHHPVHCKTFSSIPGLQLLDANNTPPQSLVGQNGGKKVPKYCQMPLGDKITTAIHQLLCLTNEEIKTQQIDEFCQGYMGNYWHSWY